MFRLLQLTDTHLRPEVTPRYPPADFADAVHDLTGGTTDQRAAAVVDRVLVESGSDGGFDLVLHTGDVTEGGGMAGCEAAFDLLDRFAAPFLVAPGNHDRLSDLSTVFGDQVATTVVHHDLADWRVVVINSVAAGGGSPAGFVTGETLVALDELLDWDGPVVVGCHHPPLSPCPDRDCVIVNADDLLEVLDRRGNVRAVLSGHLHVTDEIQRAGVRYLLSPATSLQLRHRHPLAQHNQAPTPAGARLITLHDDGILDTTVVWI